MGKIYASLTPALQAWLIQQKIFFVSTAPLGADGHINCSPKGGDSFRVLNSQQVAYQDLTGSGIETIAHLRENGRILVMFCAFEGGPQILRLYGTGEVLELAHPEFMALSQLFPENAGTRAIIRVNLSRIADSCGFAVPFYNYLGERDQLDQWATKKGPDQLKVYRASKNQTSIDGLPGLME